jgi:hypothetical protein
MRIPLSYQRTEYDCGPTAFLNALSFLFTRREIPPELVKNVMIYTLDTYSEKGEACRAGTSRMAMMFLSNWLNGYAKTGSLPIASEFLSGERIQIDANSRIVAALQQGAAVVLRVWYGDCGHYVTLTGVQDNCVLLFDPYYRKQAFARNGITFIKGNPCSANRRVDFDVFNSENKEHYCLEEFEKREAVVLYNSVTRKTDEDTIDYFI